MSNKKDTLEDLIAERDQLIEKRNKLEKVSQFLRVPVHPDSASLLSKYSKLPSLDIEKRIQYSKLTCPGMEIVSCKKERTDTKLDMDICLKFLNSGTYNIHLSINAISHWVKSLQISPCAEIVPYSYTITKLIEESVSTRNVSLFVSTMNSILRMKHKIIHTFNEIFQNLSSGVEVDNSNGFFEPILFKLPSSITLSIHWLLIIENKEIFCKSDFKVMTIKGSKISDISTVFKDLLSVNDVKVATLQLLEIL